MKSFYFNKKNLIISVTIIICIALISKFTTSYGIQNYYNTGFSTGLVTATSLNVRSGPGTGYKVVTTINKNTYIRVFAGIGDWYIVQVDGDYIGAVNKKYVKPIYTNSYNSNENISNKSQETSTENMTEDEREVFNLINTRRTNNGLSPLKFDYEVQRVAKIKAQDMTNNKYFSHISPTYGSPFEMLSNFKVSYNTAGENIAGNSTNSGAVDAWMNSSGHKVNILNSNFNYTGIGVVNSSKYGKIYVQIFIGK